MVRYFLIGLVLMSVFVVAMFGFRHDNILGLGSKSSRRPLQVFPDMDVQPKIKAQTGSAFFANGHGARVPVTGTVPMGLEIPEKTAQEGGFSDYGFSHGEDYYNTGRMGDYWGDGMPEQIEVDEAFLHRGKERYDIYCAICHGATGDGKGVTASFGIANIANLHDARFSDGTVPDGSVFKTITYGSGGLKGGGLMGPYGSVISVHDRWAIIGYIRALQAAKAAAPPADAAAPPAEGDAQPAAGDNVEGGNQ